MNKITLQGIIKDIEFSHILANIEYYKANIIVKRENNKEDIIPIKFKRFCNFYKEGDEVLLTGNVRTFSTHYEDGKNHVIPYVFTYFDKVELKDEEGNDLYLKSKNFVQLDGNICKKGDLRKTKTGLDVLDFTIANNIKVNNSIFNTYIPVVAWGKQAKQIANMKVSDKINIEGHFSSRVYKKPNSENFDLKIAYEINVDNILSEN